jgi:hypothetical protein
VYGDGVGKYIKPGLKVALKRVKEKVCRFFAFLKLIQLLGSNGRGAFEKGRRPPVQ